MSGQNKEIQYCILNPAGNITALVETKTEVSRQPSVAVRIMAEHPEVEQVGFVSFADLEKAQPQVSLRMAGGEFCGNAAMCAAALFLERSDVPKGHQKELSLRVSGAEVPVFAEIKKEAPASYDASVAMPKPLGLEEVFLEYGAICAKVPFVRMQGIGHLIMEEGTPFFSLSEQKTSAEEAACRWAEQISKEGLGLMFLKGSAPKFFLTPIVRIPGSGTLFWEHSCGSGSSACGFYYSEQMQGPVSLIFHEPGGDHFVQGSLADGITLRGHVQLTGQYRLAEKD